MFLLIKLKIYYNLIMNDILLKLLIYKLTSHGLYFSYKSILYLYDTYNNNKTKKDILLLKDKIQQQEIEIENIKYILLELKTSNNIIKNQKC